MLIPRRVKHRKQHHPTRGGGANGGTRVTFGAHGLMAGEGGHVRTRPNEAGRIASTRHRPARGKPVVDR